jgi:ABC-type transport system involved in cytochrome c biogenesis ATPase subunit
MGGSQGGECDVTLRNLSQAEFSDLTSGMHVRVSMASSWAVAAVTLCDEGLTVLMVPD